MSIPDVYANELCQLQPSCIELCLCGKKVLVRVLGFLLPTEAYKNLIVSFCTFLIVCNVACVLILSILWEFPSLFTVLWQCWAAWLCRYTFIEWLWTTDLQLQNWFVLQYAAWWIHAVIYRAYMYILQCRSACYHLFVLVGWCADCRSIINYIATEAVTIVGNACEVHKK